MLRKLLLIFVVVPMVYMLGVVVVMGAMGGWLAEAIGYIVGYIIVGAILGVALWGLVEFLRR